MKHLQQLPSETLQRSPAQQSLILPASPPDQGLFTAAELAAAGCCSSREDSMGHARVLQRALLRAAQPTSPARLYNWHAVLSCLLLLKKNICATLH